jgi:1-hydroxycarotenoid 3,4-desaturase
MRSDPGRCRLMKRIGLFNLGEQLALKPLSTMWSALGSYFSDPRLQQFSDATPPIAARRRSMAPATLMLVAHAEQDGIWLADGGMHAVARAMERLAAIWACAFAMAATSSKSTQATDGSRA